MCRCTLFNVNAPADTAQCLKRDTITAGQTITRSGIACGATMGVYCHGARSHHESGYAG